jgi:hypothetical protein
MIDDDGDDNDDSNNSLNVCDNSCIFSIIWDKVRRRTWRLREKWRCTSFFPSVLDRGEWSDSHPGRFIHGVTFPGTNWIGGRVDCSVRLAALDKNKPPSHAGCRATFPRSYSQQSACHIDFANLTPEVYFKCWQRILFRPLPLTLKIKCIIKSFNVK